MITCDFLIKHSVVEGQGQRPHVNKPENPIAFYFCAADTEKIYTLAQSQRYEFYL